jgi:NTP pyrophosphatase (non-canonical NTP hydrolase)
MNLTDLKYASLARLKDFKNTQGSMAHTENDGSDWTPNDWFTALAGEVGELGNFLKKVRREDFTLEIARPAIADELADVQCYLVILAHQLGVDLEQATISKFNRVSERVGSNVKLPLPENLFFSLEQIKLLIREIEQETQGFTEKLEANRKRLKSEHSKKLLRDGYSWRNAVNSGLYNLILKLRDKARGAL